MPTLYELTAQYQSLYEMLSQGEIDEQTFSDTLEGMEFGDHLEAKAENYAKVIRQLEHDAEFAKTEAARLADRRKAFEANAKRLKDNLYEAMKLTGKEKFKTPLFSFGIQASPERVVVDDITALRDNPDLFKPRKWDESELDKTKIKEMLKAEIPVSGAHLEQGESLRIR